MVNTLLIVMSFTIFSTAGVPHLVQRLAGVMSLNQEFGWPGGPGAWGQDGSLLDVDQIRRTDERGTEEVTEFDAATARRQYHWDTR